VIVKNVQNIQLHGRKGNLMMQKKYGKKLHGLKIYSPVILKKVKESRKLLILI